MDDSQNGADFIPREESPDSTANSEQKLLPEQVAASFAQPAPHQEKVTAIVSSEEAASRTRRFRRNLLWLLSLALAAFILTSWILVRVDGTFEVFSAGPQEIVRAQLRALDRGQLRPAYDMFSARYRGQVSFDAWHELVVTHRGMFHANVVRTGTPAQSGPGVTLELYLRGADDRNYRARFTLIRTEGRWWIDDVHWTEEVEARDFSRT